MRHRLAARSTLGPRGRGPASLGIVRLRLPGETTKHVFSGVLGDDTTLTDEPAPPVTAEDFAALSKRTEEILRKIDEDAKNRKIALIIGGASALFAAVKLGLIAFPILRAKRTA